MIASRQRVGGLVINIGDVGIEVIVTGYWDLSGPGGRVCAAGLVHNRSCNVCIRAVVAAAIHPPVVLRVDLGRYSSETGISVINSGHLLTISAHEGHVMGPVPQRSWVYVALVRHLIVANNMGPVFPYAIMLSQV